MRINELHPHFVVVFFCQVAPSQVIEIWWHIWFQHLKPLFQSYLNLRHVVNNLWTFDVKLVAKTRLSCKCYMNGQRMNMYTLTIYIIDAPFVNIMLSHDLQPNIRCNFTYATKTILVVNVHCNCFIDTNWSHKLTLFF
jgi:hypothetical protein